MLKQGKSDPTAAPSESIFNDELRKLYPRLNLFGELANFKDKPKRREDSGDEVCESRREFLDSFAYLCDIKKGGATVTATALQNLPHGNILWLAMNEDIGVDLKKYADDILRRLSTVKSENKSDIQEQIFRVAVEMCRPRIEFYAAETRKLARKCRMELREVPRDDFVRFLRTRLQKLSELSSNTTLGKCVDYCYAARKPDIESGANALSLVEAIGKPPKDVEGNFSKLVHYVGRLGATRSSVKAIVEAMFKVPALQVTSTSRVIGPARRQEWLFDQGSANPYEIVRAICTESKAQNPAQIESALHAIVKLDLPEKGLRDKLASRRTVWTTVHAELQIADRFSRKGLKFVDGDKYIGCSKYACYFCHSWLSEHQHKYVPPATHQKIITSCRGPDSTMNESTAHHLKDMYTKVCKRLGQDILDFLIDSEAGEPHMRHHFMSTEGSSYEPSQV